jgi:hypothetical protein
MASASNAGELVRINVQPADPDLPHRAFTGLIEDFRKKQLLLLADEEVQELVQITAQTKDLLYLGQVLNSLPRPDGKWDIAVSVDRTIAIL